MTIHYFHRIPLADLGGVWRDRLEPACSICGEAVALETAKTDECGRAVHENCYILKLASSVKAGPGTVGDYADRDALNSWAKISMPNAAGHRAMTGEEREQLAYLCERIQIEQAPEAFDELVMELHELLEQKQQRTDRPQANRSKRVMKH